MSGKDDGERRAIEEEVAPHTRRGGAVRLPVSEAVVFQSLDRRIDGWALNVSRGGLRAVIEDDQVVVGDAFDVRVGDGEPFAAHIVWVRPGKGGVVVGVSFDGMPFSVPPPPSTLPPSAQPPRPSEPPVTLTGAAIEGTGATRSGGSPTTQQVKLALRQAGFEAYRATDDAVHVAERVRENLIMDSGITVGVGELAVVLLVRASKGDFPGEDAEALFERARRLGTPALDRGYRESDRVVTEMPDPGDPARILDYWYQVQFDKPVPNLEDAMQEVDFALGLDKTAKR